MKSLMLFLAIGLASSDKLDRTYLPPPGSKFAGGSPGAIDVPLEVPKETYSTTLRPLSGLKEHGLSPGDSRLTVGIDRVTGLPRIPSGFPDLGTIPGSQAPSTYFHDSNKLPTTTSSYAFTQTTTFPSTDGFETTISPLGSVSGFPIDNHQSGLVNYPQPSNLGQRIDGQIHSGFGQPGVQTSGQQQGVPSTPASNIPYPGATYQTPASGGQTFDPRQPQLQGQYQPGFQPSSTVSPILGSRTQPGFVPQSPGQYQEPNQYLGVQPPAQLIGQQGSFPSTIIHQGVPQGVTGPGLNVPQQLGGQHLFQPGASQTTFPSNAIPTRYLPQAVLNSHTDGDNVTSIPGGILQGTRIPQQQLGGQRPFTVGPQGSFPSTVSPQGIPSTIQPGSSQYQTGFGNIPSTIAPGSNILQQIGGQRPGQFGGQQGVFSSTVSPHGVPSYNQPGTSQYGTNLGNIQDTVTPGSINRQPGLLPGQQALQFGQPGSNIPNQSVDQYQPTDGRGQQQFPTTARPGIFGRDQNIYRPDSTASSSILPPGYSKQPSFPGTTPTTFPSYGTTPAGNVYSTTPGYPGISDQGNIGNIPPGRFASQPKRPQAESDRNAVILNYENVLTPEGFAYSFDTSNGIHADESGTATDGVKAQGSYSYTGDDGKVYSIIYSADENGFQPRGDHLPTPPPVPEAIQRVIEQAAIEKEAGISHDGSYDEDKYGDKKYQGLMDRYRPHAPDRIVTDGADIPGDYENQFDERGNKKFSDGRRPVASIVENPDEYKEDIDEDEQLPGGVVKYEDKRKRPTNRIPSRRPSKPSNQGQYEITYDEDEKTVERDQPAGPIMDHRIQYYPGQKDSRRPRPTTSTRKPGLSETSEVSYPESEDNYNDEFPEETEGYDNKRGQVLDKNKRPLSPHRLPTKASGTKYQDDDSQDLPDESDEKEQTVTGKPKGTKRPGYTSFDRGNGPVVPGKSFGTKYIESDYSDETPQKPGRPGLGQQSVSGRPKGPKRPGFSTTTKDQSSKSRLPEVSTPQREQYDDNREDIAFNKQTKKPGKGYQYLPPQNKFDQGEVNRFPSRFTETGQATSKRPTNRYESDRKTTAQPFITPNVSRKDESTYEEDVDQSFPSRKPGKTSAGNVKPAPTDSEEEYDFEFKSDKGPEYYDEETGSDQDIGDERITSTEVRPGKPGKTIISSTRRPVFGSQPTTGRPQYNEQYTPASKDRITPKRPMRPGQITGDTQYPLDSDTSFEGRPAKPTETYTEQRIGSSKRPGYDFVSSTTPFPSRFETQPDGSYQQKIRPQYPTTYEPMGMHQDETVTRRPGFGSRIPSTRPTSGSMYYERTKVPESPSLFSPTSKPVIDYSDGGRTTLEPSTIRPGYSRLPSGRPTFEAAVDYDRTSVPGAATSRPGNSRLPSDKPSSTNYYDRTVFPGSTTIRPGSRIPGRAGVSQIQDIPSTTYRPNYAFTDRTLQPGVTVDAFGRPISSEPGQSFTGSTTYRPEYSTISSTGLPTMGTYQDSLRQGQSQTSETFKPNEPRFRQPDFESPQSLYRGQVSSEFSPIQGQGAEGPYRGQSSTERFLGEDFSGPKRPQGFDPQTGYYY